MTFSKVLIANRGEIALRIQKTLSKMHIASIALYTDAEADDLHVRHADEAVCLGNGTLEQTWLNIPLIIQIALEHGADAIHPGYGFLSENAHFAKAVEEAGITFIGPQSHVIEMMGSKTRAAEMAQKANIPLLPRVEGTPSQLIRQGASLGFPLLVKAAAGGGGKGMIRIDSAETLEQAVYSASQQAQRYFGDDRVYLEKLLEKPRHIEMQILADHHGNCIHLMERECTLQRNHQKVVEEAPSLHENNKNALYENALSLARSVEYRNAGTIEFLMDEQGRFYFLEMNTRIQVEHPVTEMITGIDIVQQQIRIAQGMPLDIRQEQVQANGHAIECRLYAEDPAQNYKPSAGILHKLLIPVYPGVRIDSSMENSGKVHPQFDAMIAKIVTHAPDRIQAIAKMEKVLNNMLIHGVTTNQNLLSGIMKSDAFVQNQISTQSISENLKSWAQKPEDKTLNPLVAALHIWLLRYNAPQGASAWRMAAIEKTTINNDTADVFYHPIGDKALQLRHGGQMHQVENIQVDRNKISCVWNKTPYRFVFNNSEGNTMFTREGFHYHVLFTPKIPAPKIDLQGNLQKALELKASLYGRVLRIQVAEKQKVKSGDTLLVLESMKMENTVIAPYDHTISHINVKEGDQVADGQILISFES